MIDDPQGIILTDKQLKSRRSRNFAIAAVCVAMVLLFYVMTWAKFDSSILNRAF